ncbi:MAG: winged helix-turn-helix domain-containing protein [Sphingorhabdus sp.]
MEKSEVRVGRFTLQPYRQLRLDGFPVPIGRKALDILSTLAAAKGALVTKSELMDVVWPGLTVEENAIQVHVVALRKALGDDAERLITVRGLGYRLGLGGTDDVPATGLQARNSVAILSFVNMTGNPQLEYLGEGMAEELINTLSRTAGLKVPSRTSSFAFKGRTIDARQISSELGVATLLEGSVRIAGDRVRVTAQLIDAADGIHIWSQNFDHEFSDLLALQCDITSAIVQSLERYLQPEQEPGSTKMMLTT